MIRLHHEYFKGGIDHYWKNKIEHNDDCGQIRCNVSMGGKMLPNFILKPRLSKNRKGHVAQLVARVLSMHKVPGSIPGLSISFLQVLKCLMLLGNVLFCREHILF